MEAVIREGASHAERDDGMSSATGTEAEQDGRLELGPIRNMTLVEASKSATWSDGLLIRVVTQKWRPM